MPRTAATNRSAASNRVKVLDIKSSLSLNTTNSKVNIGDKTFFDNTPFTIAGWVKGSTTGALNFFGYHYNYFDNLGWMATVEQSSIAFKNGSSFPSITGLNITKNKWNFIVITYNGSGIVKAYINGVLGGTASFTFKSRTGSNVECGLGAAGTDTSSAKVNTCQFSGYNVELTATEILDMYATGIPSSRGLLFYLPLQEGAGTIAYDTSGNANHGTITAGTFTSDVPTKKRGVVGGNLVYNGDFEYAPPTNVAQTTMNRWIDGSATGSTTNQNFGVYLAGAAGTSAVFDNTVKQSGSYSIKTSLNGTSRWQNLYIGTGVGSPSNYIQVLPNTSYTLSGWMKTSYVSGDSNGGARLAVNNYTGSYAYVVAVAAAWVKTTTNWTHYTVTFTTGSTVRYVRPLGELSGDTGTATLIMDAWFDDITLTPTTNTTRTAIT